MNRNQGTSHIARGLRATIRQLELLKRHQPARIDELSRRQEEMRAKLRELKEKSKVDR
jgi:hypothetical protein